MKKYIIVSPEDSVPKYFTRIQSMEYYRLYPNVFFVKTELGASDLYKSLCPLDSQNIRLVVFEVNDEFWGYASKDFWPWIKNIEDSSKK